MTEQTVGKNKVVYLTYSIINGQGQVFEQYDIPIGYVHGASSDMFEKVEQALEGRQVGDRLEVMLTPEEGFGGHHQELTFTDDIENVPPEFRHIGAEVEFENDQGETMQFRVTHIENGKLTIDGNHPLAGQTVMFVLNVVAVRSATLGEIASGTPDDKKAPQLH